MNEQISNFLPYFGWTKLFNESPLNITGFTLNFKQIKITFILPHSLFGKTENFSQPFYRFKDKSFCNWNQFEYVIDKKISNERRNKWTKLNWIPKICWVIFSDLIFQSTYFKCNLV